MSTSQASPIKNHPASHFHQQNQNLFVSLLKIKPIVLIGIPPSIEFGIPSLKGFIIDKKDCSKLHANVNFLSFINFQFWLCSYPPAEFSGIASGHTLSVRLNIMELLLRCTRSWHNGKAFISRTKGPEFDALCHCCACMYILNSCSKKIVLCLYSLYVRPVFYLKKNCS